MGVMTILRNWIKFRHNKYLSEFDYWNRNYKMGKGMFRNDWYKDIFLGITGESKDVFSGKIIADWGCGPRGSLVWADTAALRIGIDVLVPQYIDAFFPCMKTHNMLYVASTEQYIPLPDNFVDIISTCNSLDHCDNFNQMVSEIFRILKPGGLFIGSFNLNESPTLNEPQCLTYTQIHDQIIDKYGLKIIREKCALQGKHPDSPMKYMREHKYIEPEHIDRGKASLLWLYCMKPMV